MNSVKPLKNTLLAVVDSKQIFLEPAKKVTIQYFDR